MCVCVCVCVSVCVYVCVCVCEREREREREKVFVRACVFVDINQHIWFLNDHIFGENESSIYFRLSTLTKTICGVPDQIERHDSLVFADHLLHVHFRPSQKGGHLGIHT